MKFHKWPIARDVREESAGDDGGRRREWTDPWRPGREGERVGVKERERERADERVARESQAESYIAPTTLIVYWERTLKD